MIVHGFVILELCVNNQYFLNVISFPSSVYDGRYRNSRRRRRLGLLLAQHIEFLLEVVLKCGHILHSLTTTKAHKRIFETQLVFRWCEACYHLNKVSKKRGERNRWPHLFKLMLVIKRGAHIGKREKEPSAWTERVVVSFSLERGTDQI